MGGFWIEDQWVTILFFSYKLIIFVWNRDVRQIITYYLWANEKQWG
jgi:hypothetical protein